MKKSVYVIETKKNSDGTASAKNGFVYTPKVQFAGGAIKWYPDKYKEHTQ